MNNETKPMPSAVVLPDQPQQPLALTEENFAAAVEKYPLLMVDFWAEWCGPCRMIGTELHELAAEMSGRLVIGKVNVDEENALAEKFKIQTIPNIVIFHNGQAVGGFIGYKCKKEMVKILAPLMA